jgi:hypothetical protein
MERMKALALVATVGPMDGRRVSVGESALFLWC